jgi:peptidoglycan/xylan/chitin deacetylase (PgdA/CDA1 family)
VVLVPVAVLVLASGLAVTRIVQQRGDRIRVTVLVGGLARQVRVDAPATVAAALDAGDIVPRPGRLLSVVTKTVLDPELSPVSLLVDGMPATLESPVLAGATIGLVEPPDVDEDVVDGSDAIAPPPMPQVISGLWHPGHPGTTLNRKGAVSGELVAEVEVQPPMPPAPVTGKLVALTFDDGPGTHTPEVLRILREKNVKATFCVVGQQLKKDALATALGAIGEGHRLCNHTVTHDAKLPGRSQKAIDEEIRGANRLLVERTGVKPAYYRPPAGKLGAKVEATAKDEGQQVLLWTVDTKDFQKPAPEAIIATVMANVKPGGVILLHDGGGDRSTTLAALPALIDQLRSAGYEMVLPDAVAPVPAAPLTDAGLPA